MAIRVVGTTAMRESKRHKNALKLTAPRVGRTVHGGVAAAAACAFAHRRRSLARCSAGRGSA
jgi:hypothetical protein